MAQPPTIYKTDLKYVGQYSSQTVDELINSVKSSDYYQLDPKRVHPITLGATAPGNLIVPGFGLTKLRGENSYYWGVNFGTLGTAGQGVWSDLTGWVVDPYGGFGAPPGINIAFRDAMAQFKPDYWMYPKGNLANYWDWFNDDFVTPAEFALLPDEYNNASVDYREVRPAAHIDNFSAWFQSLASVNGVGPQLFINGNIYLETGVNTTNPNLADDNIKIQALVYRNRPVPLDVTYIEIGHEYYTAGGSVPDVPSLGGGHAQRFPNGSDYANAYLRYLAEIRGDVQLSTVYCAANLATPSTAGGTQGVRRNAWNSSFINTYFNNPTYTADPILHKLDAISIHSFYKVPLPATPNLSSYANFESWILTAADNQYIKLRDTIDDCKNLINTANSSIAHFMPKFWAIGYNLDDDELTSNGAAAISGCWGHGLFNLHYQFRVLADPDISLAAFHATHGGRQYALTYSITNGFGGGTTDLYDLTATGWIFQILRQAEDFTDIIRPLSVQGASPALTQALGIYGMMFSATPIWLPGPPAPGTKATSIVFTNLSNVPRILDLSSIIDPTDVILYYRSAVAPLRAEINRITATGKVLPNDVTVNAPPTSSVLTYTIQPYEVLHIAIAAV